MPVTNSVMIGVSKLMDKIKEIVKSVEERVMKRKRGK